MATVCRGTYVYQSLMDVLCTLELLFCASACTTSKSKQTRLWRTIALALKMFPLYITERDAGHAVQTTGLPSVLNNPPEVNWVNTE